ncbi:hypothetical protein BIW11_12552 [Tropilaelaps mercedesae]|uniref:Uncharacterized protein n=1 Tax=Tropilaelaps mercedesae TaxID=418985 RepID=A0A1V9X643_9ACAR|nr:hypothetical protein BIW11_12552 [Tropilaelaps mercedesae]
MVASIGRVGFVGRNETKRTANFGRAHAETADAAGSHCGVWISTMRVEFGVLQGPHTPPLSAEAPKDEDEQASAFGLTLFARTCGGPSSTFYIHVFNTLSEAKQSSCSPNVAQRVQHSARRLSSAPLLHSDRMNTHTIDFCFICLGSAPGSLLVRRTGAVRMAGSGARSGHFHVLSTHQLLTDDITSSTPSDRRRRIIIQFRLRHHHCVHLLSNDNITR